ncbi:glycerophosphodiester phosphodiesterase family protein [Liberiplasma polymorphum]|uniref:glycerophosphodiester phosphodiesterase family protein n=1 Tax=Liberiplasma polymorphum TaxID=3374570 RepID=UPI00377362AC
MLKTKPILRKIGFFVLSFFVVWSLLAFSPKPNNIDNNPFIVGQGNRPVIIAHGGGNQEFPDNTLEAYYNAFSIDPTVMLETDVSLTKDGVIILTHDTTLDRRTSLQYAEVIETNYSDLIEQEINFGYYNNIEPFSNGFNVSGELIEYRNYRGEIVTPLDVNYPEGIEPRHETVFLATTLEELIKAFPNNYMNVEIKQRGDVGIEALEKVIELMDELDDDYNTFGRIVLATFHEEIYDQFVNLRNTTHPELMYSPQNRVVQKYYILQVTRLSLFFRDEIAVLQVPTTHSGLDLSTRNFISTAQRHNIAVHYWTINDEDEMRRLIELGVDGIMTDRVQLLKNILDEYYGD